MNNPLAWSPAQRCLAASGIDVVFALLFLAVYAHAFWYPHANPEVNQAFLPTAAWVVALTGCGMSLLCGISYWQRYRLGPSPWLTIATVALCTWVVGLTLFSARQMGVNLLSTLFFNSVLLMGAYAGQIPYAPFFNTTEASIGQVNPGLLRPMNAIIMLLLGVVLAIVYFIVARWKQREAELLAVGETLGKANGIISRYVAVQLADEVRNGNYAALERHERRKLTLFFSDIKNFSTIADAIEPEDLSLLLNDYLSEMTLIAQRYGATIDKFVGDAIMIFFGAPHCSTDRDQVLRAVRMGIEMQHSMQVLREKWVVQGITHPFHIRIGINTGQASVGAFGSQQRLEYTAIGRQVNLAACIQAHCLPDHVLISHSTWSLVHDQISCVAQGEADFQGSHEPVQIFEVTL